MASGQLDSSLLAEVWSKDPRMAHILQTIIDGVNATARNVGVSPTGDLPAPKAPDAVQVKVSGEMMHVSISHTGPIDRDMHYFAEIHTDPSFNSPIVEPHVSSRCKTPYSLPTYQDNGTTKHNYYVRAYAQRRGGPPSQPMIVGGIGSPTAFQMGGATNMTLLPSTGSGTAPNSGQSAGQGFGKFQKRQT